MKKSIELIDTDVQKLEANPVLHTLCAYYLWQTEDLNTLLKLVHRTKQPEL